jgi:integrase
MEQFPAGGWGVIHVRDGWDRIEGRIDPKSDAGVRTVLVPSQLFAVLSERVTGSGLAFGEGETPWSYNAVRERAELVWKRAGIEPHDLRFHQARHTYRTLLADAGIPRDRREGTPVTPILPLAAATFTSLTTSTWRTRRPSRITCDAPIRRHGCATVARQCATP